MEDTARGKWGKQIEFLLSLIGYCVGLGNIWRFPFKCYKNGGGAFLIPYILMLLLTGMPLYFMELSLGQFTSLGPIRLWNLAPLFRGLGIGMIIIDQFCNIYYNMIIAWILYYLGSSFTSSLPWIGCDHEWNTVHCGSLAEECRKEGGVGNLMANSSGFECIYNLTSVEAGYVQGNNTWAHPAEEFFTNKVLRLSDGMDDMGEFVWQLFICLLVAWLVVWFCVIKGIKTSGKVVYVTATVPYVFLVVLFVRGVTLPGAVDGIKFYITPDFNRLASPSVWIDAGSQIFYSLGLAFGALQTMASYNKFSNNVYRDAVLVSAINCFTSIFAGFVIFSVIGFMAQDMKSDVATVVSDGPGLAFIVYPEALSRLPCAPVWSTIFFLMLFNIGLDSQFVGVEIVVTAILDAVPSLRSKKVLVSAGVCLFSFVCGLPMCLQGGMYILTLIDWYSASFSLMAICLVETVVISYVYGVKRFCLDVYCMTGYRPGLWWKACWMLISPGMMVFVLVFSFVQYSPVTYKNYVYPLWSEVFGFVTVLLSALSVPIWVLYSISKEKGSIIERVYKLARPNSQWGPANSEDRYTYSCLLKEEGYDFNDTNSCEKLDLEFITQNLDSNV